MVIFTYILRCADGSDYVGTARNDLDRRIAEHNAGHYRGYTSRRRPVELVWAQEYEDPYDAIAAERRIKGWSRAKKEALIAGDFEALRLLAKRPGARQRQDVGGTARPRDKAGD